MFLVIHVKKPVLFNRIVFADMSLARRSFFTRCTPCYRSHNSDGKNECFRVFAISLILTRITSSCTPWWLLIVYFIVIFRGGVLSREEYNWLKFAIFISLVKHSS